MHFFITAVCYLLQCGCFCLINEKRVKNMAICLVTGAAGFIGSHLCEELLARGHRVLGVDTFIPYYPRTLKEHNVSSIRNIPGFTFYEVDLRREDLLPLLKNVEVVFHLAAMAGLVRSWSDFDLYMTCNIGVTQRLLEAAHLNNIKHFIHGSTSSVYGRCATGAEDSPLEPVSPYGVTKLGAEHLCRAYAENFRLPLTILRFFSVYGPRQRPDMAYNIFIRSLLHDEPITIYGDGEQSRSNTFVADCVRGIVLAFEKRGQSVGQIFNLGGGEIVTLNQVLDTLAGLLGRRPRITFAQARPGDQRHTAANIEKAHRLLGYTPSTSVTEGLQAQVEWQRTLSERQRTLV
jgi:UDP-glucuronate 4-epimerase